MLTSGYCKKKNRALTKAAVFMALVGLSHAALSQGLSFTDELGAPGGTATTSHGYVAQNDLSAISVDIFFDETVITPQVDNPADPAPDVTGCLASPGGNWSSDASSCRLVGPDQIRLVFATGFAADTALDTADPFGSITWDIAAGASPGTVVPLTVQIDSLQAAPDGSQVDDSNLTVDEGSVSVQAPAGEGFYSSTPDPGGNLDYGAAEVGTAATPVDTLNVQNPSPDTDFDITAFNEPSGAVLAFPGTPITVPFGNNVDVNISCTPSSRGDNGGNFEVTHDSVNGASSPVGYTFDCGGLAPNVTLPGPLSMTGTVAGADPTAAINVTNPQDGFTSTANNVTATEGAGDAEITLTGTTTTNINPDGNFDFTVTCDSTVDGTFARTIDFTWDNPDPAGPTSGSVDVDCTVTDVDPIYNSDPAPSSTLTMTADFGNESAPSGIDVNNANTNPAGDDLVINSATADDPVFSVDLINDTFPPNQPADGSDDIEVTCTPEGVGTVNGTLTVDTNDPNQPAGGFTYDLVCEGTGDSFTIDPAAGGTLNLGTVPPGDTTPPGTIDFTNNQLSGDQTFECTVLGGDTAEISGPNPATVTVTPGATESMEFQCTPSDIATFSIDLSCGQTARGLVTATHTVTCTGRPLNIPTMSNWGLVLMSLMLLLVGGLAGRRMLA